MTTRKKFSTGTAAGIILLLIVVLAVADRATGFSEKRIDNMKKEKMEFIGKPGIQANDGVMTPEILLSFGKVSDPQVSPDGKTILYGVSYTSVKDNRSCNNLYLINTDGSGRQQLTRSGKSFSNARWSLDGKQLIYIQDGQIWSAPVKGKEGRKRLGKAVQLSDIPDGISEFKLSPDQSQVMYVSSVQSSLKKPSDLYPDITNSSAISADDLMYRHWDHWVENIPHTFVADLATGKSGRKSITKDSSTDILNGEPYELPTEPFSGIEQLSWSPDGRYIAYSCRKLTGKRYAFSTDTEIYIYEVSTGKTSVIDMKGGYDTNPVWSPDGSMLCWISMERDGYEADKQRLMVADITSAPANAAGIRNIGDITGLAVSGIRDLTADFRYNAAGPVWSHDSRHIYFNALAEGIQGIFRASVSGSAADSGTGTETVERITGEDMWYDFGSPFHIMEADGCTSLLTTWCSMDFPDELVAVSIGQEAVPDNGGHCGDAVQNKPLKGACKVIGEPVAYKAITAENKDILDSLDEPLTEARYIRTVDGKDMLTWVIYPPHFDPSKEYPSILICLGGPQGTLSQGWSYRWNYRLMASQGYITVLPNRRGTTAFGQDWTEQISGDYCGLNMQDYLSAARALKAEPYVGKMAACGASYGGYSIYYLSGIHRNTFDAFIAHAGIFNEEHMYMTTEEMWFANWDNGGLHEYEADSRVGTPDCPVGPAGDGETFGGIRQGGSPWSNAPKAVRHYANSPHKLVTEWDTPILVTHGGMDFRVPVDEGMAAYNAAQLMGVPSRLIVFPDENHWILKPQNALYWHREYFRWLDRWCKTEE